MENVDPAIPQELKVRLEEILRKRIKAISMNEDDLGRTSLAIHHIDTGNAPPVRQGMRRIPQAHAQAVDSQLENMIRQKLIRPSKSDFASNVVLVKKKDNTWRFCVDYRKVNDITRKDAYPLPRIDECLDTLTGSAWFTTIDLRSGYFQVEISEEDAHKTAFITIRGLYEFQVMPQGMCNSAATFQRLMNLVLAGLNYEICLVYIDDIIIFSKDLNEHLDRLEVVLQKLEEAGLKIRPDKCKMLQREVHFLGHVISGDGIRTSPSKTEVVATWPVPTKVTELRSFIGLCSYYRRFIKDFAKTAKPLHALTGKYARFHWTPDCQAAFDELKQKMITAPVVAFPRDDDTYILDCDASLESIGAVLSQLQDGEERVISYASRLYSKSESNYCVTRRELLAVVHFCKYYKQYLLGRHFIVRTDHSALTWLRKTPEPIGQQSRWLEQLEEFSFTVEHRSGNKHTNADAMSRRPCRQCHMCDNEDESYATEVKEINTITTAPVVDEVDMSVRPKQFQVGQKVLYYYPRRYRFRSPKWQKMYIGPYEVVKQLGPLNYVIKKCNGRHEIIAHIDKMKPYLGHLYEPQEDTSYHDTPDNNDIGPPNTDTLNERLGTVDSPPTSNLSPRPARSRKPPAKYRDFVLFLSEEPNGQRLARPAPTPRRCKFCEVVLNGKRAQTLHVQSVHRDILQMKKTQAQERGRLQKQSGDVPGLAAV